MDDIRSRHVPIYPPAYKATEGPSCAYDRNAWPCDAIREADEKDRLQELVLGQGSIISGLSIDVEDAIARADKAEAALAAYARLAANVEDVDPTVYLYDAVYHAIVHLIYRGKPR